MIIDDASRLAQDLANLLIPSFGPCGASQLIRSEDSPVLLATTRGKDIVQHGLRVEHSNAAVASILMRCCGDSSAEMIMLAAGLQRAVYYANQGHSTRLRLLLALRCERGRWVQRLEDIWRSLEMTHHCDTERMEVLIRSALTGRVTVQEVDHIATTLVEGIFAMGEMREPFLDSLDGGVIATTTSHTRQVCWEDGVVVFQPLCSGKELHDTILNVHVARRPLERRHRGYHAILMWSNVHEDELDVVDYASLSMAQVRVSDDASATLMLSHTSQRTVSLVEDLCRMYPHMIFISNTPLERQLKAALIERSIPAIENVRPAAFVRLQHIATTWRNATNDLNLFDGHEYAYRDVAPLRLREWYVSCSTGGVHLVPEIESCALERTPIRTLHISAPLEGVAQLYRRAIVDALCFVRHHVTSGVLLPGAGAAELWATERISSEVLDHRESMLSDIVTGALNAIPSALRRASGAVHCANLRHCTLAHTRILAAAAHPVSLGVRVGPAPLRPHCRTGVPQATDSRSPAHCCCMVSDSCIVDVLQHKISQVKSVLATIQTLLAIDGAPLSVSRREK